MAAFVANSNVIELLGLKNDVTDAFINSATVTVTVKDSLGVNVTGVTWPFTMNYVAASSGDYRATLSEALALIARATYYAHIEANGGSGLVGHWEFKFKPQTRTT